MFSTKTVKWSLFVYIAVFVGSLHLSAYSQQSESRICNAVKSNVVLPLKPPKMGVVRTWETECNFNLWYSANRKLAIYVEKYDSDAKGAEEFARFSRILTVYDDPVSPPRTRYQTINGDRHWSEAIAYKNEKSGHFILLRSDSYLITLISSDYRLLTGAEKLFRSVRFEDL